MAIEVKFLGKDSSIMDKTFELLRPKRVYIGNHMTRSFPINRLFERDGGIYIGPKDAYFYHNGVFEHHPGRYADEESKWLDRECLLEFSMPGADILNSFSKTKYEEFIRSKMWDEIPELYGKIIACWCIRHCSCQVSVLRKLVCERIRKDFLDVGEEKFKELKLEYALSKKEMDILEHEVRSYESHHIVCKSELNCYLACIE